MAAGALVLATARSAGAVVTAGVLAGTGHGYTFPILLGLAVTRASDNDRRSAMGFFTAITNVGVLVGGPLLGLIITLSGYTAMYTATMVLTLVGVAAFAISDRPQDAALAGAIRALAIDKP